MLLSDLQQLIQLTEIPIEEWVGKTVFHPHEQRGNEPIWFSEEEGELLYDVGEVVEYDPKWFPEGEENSESFPHRNEVWFRCIDDFCPSIKGTFMLHYEATNLWVVAE